MFRLPVSGLGVDLCPPTGMEDLMLAEMPGSNTGLALALVSRLAGGVEEQIDWAHLTVTDLEVLLLRLRQTVFGDLIRTDVICPVETCGRRIDVSFRIEDYLDHHGPRRARGVEVAEEPGWFRLRDNDITFRLPSAADQAAVAGLAEPKRELIRRCIRPTSLSARRIQRVERAMEALAPSLSDIQGECLECHTVIDMHFDVQRFVLRELRDRAELVYQDIHLLARYYHWPEEKILALPTHRRSRYAEMLAEERRQN